MSLEYNKPRIANFACSNLLAARLILTALGSVGFGKLPPEKILLDAFELCFVGFLPTVMVLQSFQGVQCVSQVSRAFMCKGGTSFEAISSLLALEPFLLLVVVVGAQDKMQGVIISQPVIFGRHSRVFYRLHASQQKASWNLSLQLKAKCDHSFRLSSCLQSLLSLI